MTAAAVTHAFLADRVCVRSTPSAQAQEDRAMNISRSRYLGSPHA